MAYCNKCGGKLNKDDMYCQKCGEKIEKEAGKKEHKTGGHSKKRKYIMWGIVALIVFLIVLGGSRFMMDFIRESMAREAGMAPVQKRIFPPRADNPLAFERKINIKFKGEQEVQIGFYNNASETKYNLEPIITNCKTANGQIIAEESMPTISTASQDKVEPGETKVWDIKSKLPDIDVQEGATDSGQYTGALAAGQYICEISLYGTEDSENFIDPQNPADESYLDSTQFFLQVTK
ncbi:MAG: hypothetical protein R6U32_03905 [Candidatus Woesearchaeota archaeon]